MMIIFLLLNNWLFVVHTLWCFVLWKFCILSYWINKCYYYYCLWSTIYFPASRGNRYEACGDLFEWFSSVSTERLLVSLSWLAFWDLQWHVRWTDGVIGIFKFYSLLYKVFHGGGVMTWWFPITVAIQIHINMQLLICCSNALVKFSCSFTDFKHISINITWEK